MLWTDGTTFYEGDCRIGDRSATPEEVAALEMARKPNPAAIIEAKKTAVRDTRKTILDVLAGIAVAAQISGDTDTTAAYLVVRQGLLSITDGWPTDPNAIDALVMSRYAALQAQCTQAMEKAFREVMA